MTCKQLRNPAMKGSNCRWCTPDDLGGIGLHPPDRRLRTPSGGNSNRFGVSRKRNLPRQSRRVCAPGGNRLLKRYIDCVAPFQSVIVFGLLQGSRKDEPDRERALERILTHLGELAELMLGRREF